MKSSKILGDEWKPVSRGVAWEPMSGEWRPMGISYEEEVKVNRDIYHAQVAITQTLIAILQNRIEKKLIEIKRRHCE